MVNERSIATLSESFVMEHSYHNKQTKRATERCVSPLYTARTLALTIEINEKKLLYSKDCARLSFHISQCFQIYRIFRKIQDFNLIFIL